MKSHHFNFKKMSYNREVKPETIDLFSASEKGDIKAVGELLKHPDVDVNWHRRESVSVLYFVWQSKTHERISMVPLL